MIKKLLFAVVIAAVAGNAYADTTTQTVTTQNYVDTNFQTKIPAKTNSLDYVITATDTAGVTAQRALYDEGRESGYNDYNYIIDTFPEYADAVKGQVPTMNGLTGVMKWMIPANGVGNVVKNAPSGERIHYLPEFSDTAGRLYRIRTVNSMEENIGNWQRYNVIPTLAALDSGMETKQDKMTCARYITGAEETSENCLLWNLPD